MTGNGAQELPLDLDRSFRFDPPPLEGYVEHEPTGLLCQSDGTILVFGRIAGLELQGAAFLYRLLPDGTPDPDFLLGDVAPSPYQSHQSSLWDAALQPDEKILLAGDFNPRNSSLSRTNLARLNPDGTFDTGFNTVTDRRVEQIWPYPDGRILIAGSFTEVNGVPIPGLARLPSDGSLDESFQLPSLPLRIRKFACQSDGRIIVAGVVQDPYSIRLVRLDEDGALDAQFAGPVMLPGLRSAQVADIEVANDDSIICVGDFLLDTIGQSFVCRLKPDGSVDEGFRPEVNDSCFVATLEASGSILLGGRFTYVNGVPRAHLARVLKNGQLDPDFNEFDGPNSWVSDVAIQPSKGILAAGDFWFADGLTSPGLARFFPDDQTRFQFPAPELFVREDDALATLPIQRSGNTETEASVLIESLPGTATSPEDFTAFSERITLAPGEFQKSFRVPLHRDLSYEPTEIFTVSLRDSSVGTVDGFHEAAVFLSDDESPGTLDPVYLTDSGARSQGYQGKVWSLLPLPTGHLLIAGSFETFHGFPRHSICKLTSEGAVDLSFVPSCASLYPIGSLAPGPEDTFYAIGGFDCSGSSKHLVRLFLDGNLDHSFEPELPSGNALSPLLPTEEGGVLMALGNSLTKLLPSGRRDVSFNTNALLTGPIAKLAADPAGRIYVGGEFRKTGGQIAGLVRIDRNGNLDPGFNLSPPATNSSRIEALAASQDGSVFAAGLFYFVGETERQRLVKFNHTGEWDRTFRPPSLTSAADLLVQLDGKVIAACPYDAEHSLLRLNEDGSVDETFTPVSAERLWRIALNGESELYIGGEFQTVNGFPIASIAQIQLDPPFVFSTEDHSFTLEAPPLPLGFVIERSTDLTAWQPYLTNTAPVRVFQLEAPEEEGGFFRAKSQDSK